MSVGARQCCCSEGFACERDCIWQTDIESGCCHKDDVLLLWCERPGYSVRQNHSAINGAGTILYETCCTTAFAGYAPVQAIYHFYNCFWRCLKVPIAGVQYLDTMPAICPQDTVSFPCEEFGGVCDSLHTDGACQVFWESSLNGASACNVGCGFDIGCCAENENDNCMECCKCNTLFMSDWRRRVCAATPRFKWLVEMTCHKNGLNLGTGAGCDVVQLGANALYNCSNLRTQALCVVHMERWWKIAEDCGVHKIYVPGCAADNCDGVAYQTDDLVPKWWFFACSGIPLYAGDLIDAVRFGHITPTEAEDLLDALAVGCLHPKQATLNKLAVAGYIRANDWRDEQRQAYIDLHARFPGAGYNACIQNVEDMHTLAPFRKRMTYKFSNPSAVPLLKKGDVTTLPDLTGLQADCFINYPGSLANQADYDYWCERQWVYFRGRPGGWEWAGWSALAGVDDPETPEVEGAGGVCNGQGAAAGVSDEELALLLGYGRGDMSCVEAFYGAPLGNATQAACSCCNTAVDGVTVICKGCDAVPIPMPITSCVQVDDEQCNNLMFYPMCEGMHIMSNAYESIHDLSPNGTGVQCKQCAATKAIYTTHSFLIEGKRSRDSWLDSVPFTCRDEVPKLLELAAWPQWGNSHAAPFNGICSNFYLDNDPTCWCASLLICGGNARCNDETIYTSRMACGGFCADYQCRCIPETFDPSSGWDASMCPARTDCAPHSTGSQVACIGYNPSCSST